MKSAKLSTTQKKHAKDVFDAHDEDKDGKLELDELILAFTTLKIPNAKKQAIELVKQNEDDDGLATVDWYTFLLGVMAIGIDSVEGDGAGESSPKGPQHDLAKAQRAGQMSVIGRRGSAQSVKRSTSGINSRFSRVREVGRGGFGVTYIAKDGECLDKLVLCKYLHKVDSDSLRLFRQEAEKLLQLDHRNIPKVLAYFEMEKEKEFLLVMDYIDGKNLAQVVEESGPMPEAQVLETIMTMCNVLQYVHSQSIIHRDVKAENIMQSKSGRLYLVDFGACGAAKGGMASTVIGTPGYLPPEIAQGCATYESDFFSLGACALFLLTKKHPHQLLGGVSRSGARGSDHPFSKALGALKSAGTVSQSMHDLLDAMLQPNPSKRRVQLQAHPSGVLSSSPTNSEASLSGDESAEALKARLNAEISRDDFAERVLSLKSTDTQDTAAAAYISAGDVSPNVQECEVRVCTYLFKFILVQVDVIKSIVEGISKKMIEALNRKTADATGGKTIDVRLEGVVNDAMRMFLQAAHRYAHLHAQRVDVETLHQMRFALMYMSCQKSMAEVREAAAKLIQAVLTNSLSGPQMLRWHMQRDDFLDEVKGAGCTNEERSIAEEFCTLGDITPNVVDCKVSECTARFNFVHESASVLIGVVVRQMNESVDSSLAEVLGKRNVLEINDKACCADAYRIFVQALHHFTHVNEINDPKKLHSMRTALVIEASHKATQEVRDGAVALLEQLVARAQGDKKQQAQDTLTMAARKKKKDECCVM